jgi:hypothetical protein
MKRPIKSLILLGAISCLTAGDCVVDCMNRSGCWSGGSVTNPEMCRDQAHRCEIQCGGQGGKKSNGAIAYSRTDKGAGWSYGFDDLSKAKKVAMENCAKNGSACEVWVTYSNGCGAVAIDGKIVTWGSASTKQSADQRALSECAKAGGRSCVVQVSQCSR